MQNSFAYAANSPVTMVDVNGESPGGTEGGDDEKLRNEHGEKQIYQTKSRGMESIMSGDTERVFTPEGTPASQGMGEVELLQFATSRVLTPGIHLINEDQYVDQRLIDAG